MLVVYRCALVTIAKFYFFLFIFLRFYKCWITWEIYIYEIKIIEITLYVIKIFDVMIFLMTAICWLYAELPVRLKFTNRRVTEVATYIKTNVYLE